MNKRLICIDLDGTLMSQDGQISQRNQQALKKCLLMGDIVYFVTGRPYCFAKSLALTVDSGIGVVAGNGSCYEKNGSLVIHSIPEKAVRRFVDCLEEEPVHAFFKSLHEFYSHDLYDERFLYDRMNSWFSDECQVHSHVEMTFEELREKAADIHKILVCAENRERLKQFEKAAEKIEEIHISRYNEVSFDVTAKGVDKGKAIRDIRECREIPREAVIAIGDAPNDLPMFREAGVRIAMGNAESSIRQLCDWTTAVQKEDGVALALEKLYRK